MWKNRKSIRGLLVAAQLTLAAGCQPQAAPGAATSDLQDRYGFVSLVDGTMGVVDLQTLEVVNRVKESTRATHMLHALPGQHKVLYGDWDRGDILLVAFSDDMKTYKVEERIASPVQMHGFLTLGANDRYIIVLPRVELEDAAEKTALKDDSVGVFDRTTREWKLIKTGSPSYGVVGADGRLYVGNVHDRTVSVIDTSTWQVVQTVAAGPDKWVTGTDTIGPKGVAFSPDGKTFLSADYEGLSLSLFDVTKDGLANKRTVEMNGTPKAAVYSPDGKEIWAVTYDLNMPRAEVLAKAAQAPLQSMGAWYEGPQIGDEAANSYRHTTMHVIDAKTLREIDSFSTTRAMISPRMSPGNPDSVYVTTSAGSVYEIDRTTHKVVGEAVVGRVGLPVICGNLAL